MVGVGRTNDVNADSAVSICRLHRVASSDRRSTPCGSRRRRARHRWRNQRSDHLFLGAVVEYTAPGRNDSPPRQTKYRPADAGGPADHAGCVLALLGCRRARALALHYFGEGAKRFAPGGGERVMNWPDLSMGGYGFYVWGSYVFALVVIVWEVVSLRQRKKALANEARKALANDAQNAAANDDRPAAVHTTVLRGSTNETTS